MTDAAELQAILDRDFDRGSFGPETATVNGNGNGAHSHPTLMDPASFGARVAATRVELLRLIRDGIPARDYLPASDGMLVRGKRHYLPAPKKLGKSIATQRHTVDMVLAGARVVTLDRENGADEYARRLEAMIAALDLDDDDQSKLATNLDYYDFPRVSHKDGAELAALFAGADLVVFDSQRTFLSQLGLGEDSSDDYTKFCTALVEPLFQAGIATLILDNTGHTETGRGRGTSAKGDLNEVLFKLESVERFDLDTVGKVRLSIADSRFGNAGRWDMTIGGGNFQPWQRVDPTYKTADQAEWRPTIYMERVSRHLELHTEPVSPTRVEEDVIGTGKYIRIAIAALIREGYVDESKGRNGGRALLSKQAFREADPVGTPSEPDTRNPVETPSVPKPRNHAENATLSDPVGTPSATTASNSVGKADSPTGSSTTADAVETDAKARASLFNAQYPPRRAQASK